MDNKPDEQLLVLQANIKANRQNSDEKMKNLTEDIGKGSDEKIEKLTKYLTAMITSMMYQIKFSKSSPDKKGSPNLSILPLRSGITISLHLWKVDILQKLLACRL